MDVVKLYSELHKQLNRRQHDPSMEALLFTWCYISASKEFLLPEILSIKNWAESLYSRKINRSLKEILVEVEQQVPLLKKTFTLLLDAYETRYPPADVNHDYELYSSVFSRFDYSSVRPEDWTLILDMIIENINRRQRELDSEPADISKLAAKIFADQLLPEHRKKKLNKVVFVPSLTTGRLPVEISRYLKGAPLSYVGFESQLQAYCISVFSFIVNGLDTRFLHFGSVGDFSLQVWDCFVSFFKPSWLDNVTELEKNIKILALNSDVAVTVISQSFLFSSKFTSIRRYLIYNSNLTSIVTLSPSTYNNRIKSAILVFNNKKSSDKILLVNAENLELSKTKIVRYQQKEIDFISDILKNQIEHDGVSRSFDVVELRSDNYSLLVSHRLPEAKREINIREIRKRVLKNQQKLLSNELKLQSDFNRLIDSK